MKTTVLFGPLLALACAGCAVDLPRLQNGSELAKPQTEGEARLWAASAELEKALVRSGRVVKAPNAVGYMGEMLTRLFPAFAGHLQVHLLASPQLNAFALPDGNIYLTQGLLPCLDNDSQLAIVLGHEAIHVLHRDAAREREHRIHTVGLEATAALLGIPLIPELVAGAVTSSYSREMEREADEEGFRRLVRAGYDGRQAAAVFAHLLGEQKHHRDRDASFFASHPRLEDRLKTLSALAAALPTERAGTKTAAFTDHLKRQQLAGLELLIATGRYYAAIYNLTRPDAAVAQYHPDADYDLGEAYRLRGNPGDTAKALAALHQATTRYPQYPPPFRSLGMIEMQRGESAAALADFRRYLRLDPRAVDRGYLEEYIAELEKS